MSNSQTYAKYCKVPQTVVRNGHLATVEDEDAVRVDDGVDSMRNCERGRIGELTADDILDDVVRLIQSLLKCLL